MLYTCDPASRVSDMPGVDIFQAKVDDKTNKSAVRA